MNRFFTFINRNVSVEAQLLAICIAVVTGMVFGIGIGGWKFAAGAIYLVLSCAGVLWWMSNAPKEEE